MPWTCCGRAVLDELSTCPTCGKAKGNWTLRFDKTRVFTLGKARTLARLRMFRGGLARTGVVEVIFEDEAGADIHRELVELGSKGELAVPAPPRVRDRTAALRLYFPGTGEEGLVLDLGERGDGLLPSIASRSLRALGFVLREPLTTDAPAVQQSLELEMALARFQRTRGPTVERMRQDTLGALDARYHDYEPSPWVIPDPVVADEGLALEPLLRLRMFRGEVARAGRWQVVLDDADGKEVHTSVVTLRDGLLDLRLPEGAAALGTAAAARAYALDATGARTGEGLLLSLGERGNRLRVSTASRALRALGFAQREPLTNESPRGQEKLDLQLAIVGFQRAHQPAGTEITPYDARGLRALDRIYWGYSPKPRVLPDPEVDPPPPATTPVLRLRMARGAAARSGRWRVVLEDEAGAEVFATTATLEDGVLAPKVAPDVGAKAKSARLYSLDASGQLTGEGLLLELGERGDATKASTASRALRALGFYAREPLTSDTAKAGQEALDLELALAAFQRTRGPKVEPHGPSTLTTLDRAYWSGDPRPWVLPEPDAGDLAGPATAPLARLRLFRGDRPRAGRWRVVLEDADGAEIFGGGATVDENGQLELRVPPALQEKAAAARLYALDARGRLTGEGLLLQLGEPGDATKASTASRALRALGFAAREPLTTDTAKAGQEALDLEMALAAFQRTQGPAVAPLAAGSLGALGATYRDYTPTPRVLPEPQTEPPAPETLPVALRLRLFRGARARAGEARVVLLDGSGAELHATTARIADGVLEVRAPTEKASSAATAHVLFMRDGRPTGEGLLLTLGERPDAQKASSVSRALRAIGLYDREPLAGDTAKAGQEALDLEMALAAFQRTKGPKVEPQGAPVRSALERAYLAYAPAPRTLPAPEVAGADAPPDAHVPVVRVKLVRGERPRAGRARAVLVDASGAEVFATSATLVDGVLEVRAPRDLVEKAAAAHVFPLRPSGEPGGEALILTLVEKGDPTRASTASRALRALGVYDREPLAGDTAKAGQEALDLQMALAALQRTQGGPARPLDATSLQALDRVYSNYGPARRTLPDPV